MSPPPLQFPMYTPLHSAVFSIFLRQFVKGKPRPVITRSLPPPKNECLGTRSSAGIVETSFSAFMVVAVYSMLALASSLAALVG